MDVMVPAEKILETAREQKADIIGLSGLITPSLDEMVHVAQEMSRQDFRVPLLIGGATTSRAHTAVKIAPHYRESVVHVHDDLARRRSREHVTQRRDKGTVRCHNEERLRATRTEHAGKTRDKKILAIGEARRNRLAIDWEDYEPPVPEFVGTRRLTTAGEGENEKDTFPVSLATLIDYIDWSPFFHAWELRGRYPAIFDDKVVGRQARGLFDDAQKLLQRIVDEDGRQRVACLRSGRQTHQATISRSIVTSHEGRSSRRSTSCASKCRSRPVSRTIVWRILLRRRSRAGAIISVDSRSRVESEQMSWRNDSGRPRRLQLHSQQGTGRSPCRTFAEYLDRQARVAWGFGKSEGLTKEDMIRERYRGVRPRRVIRHVRTMSKSARSLICSRWKATPGSR